MEGWRDGMEGWEDGSQVGLMATRTTGEDRGGQNGSGDHGKGEYDQVGA
jgi:hypothetical protein